MPSSASHLRLCGMQVSYRAGGAPCQDSHARRRQATRRRPPGVGRALPFHRARGTGWPHGRGSPGRGATSGKRARLGSGITTTTRAAARTRTTNDPTSRSNPTARAFTTPDPTSAVRPTPHSLDPDPLRALRVASTAHPLAPRPPPSPPVLCCPGPDCRRPAPGPPAPAWADPPRPTWTVEEGGSGAKRRTPLPPSAQAGSQRNTRRRGGGLLRSGPKPIERNRWNETQGGKQARTWPRPSAGARPTSPIRVPPRLRPPSRSGRRPLRARAGGPRRGLPQLFADSLTGIGPSPGVVRCPRVFCRRPLLDDLAFSQQARECGLDLSR
jgi:hypothetical protein